MKLAPLQHFRKEQTEHKGGRQEEKKQYACPKGRKNLPHGGKEQLQSAAQKNGGYVKEETGEKIVPETFVGIGDTHHQKGNGKGEKKKKGFIRGEKEREKGVKPTHSGGKENPALFQRPGLQLSP